MALLLNELQWTDEPLVPRVPNAAWEAEVTSIMGLPDASSGCLELWVAARTST
jgi:hypothetical protein